MKKPFRIVKQGAIELNYGVVIAESKDIVCLEIDLRSKRAEIDGYMDNNTLILGASEHTLHLHKSKTGETLISFPNWKNHFIFAAEISRYTLRVCLVKRD